MEGPTFFFLVYRNRERQKLDSVSLVVCLLLDQRFDLTLIVSKEGGGKSSLDGV